MTYPTYLAHFNQNHSPKTGQFINGDGDGDGIIDDHRNQRKTAYGGKSKKDYVTKMQSEYESAGHRKSFSKQYAKKAAMMNERYTKFYNQNMEKAKSFGEKAKAALRSGDTKAYESNTKKMLAAYRNARIDDEMIKRSYDLGKAVVKSSNAYMAGGVLNYSIYEGTNADSVAKIQRQVVEKVDSGK